MGAFFSPFGVESPSAVDLQIPPPAEPRAPATGAPTHAASVKATLKNFRIVFSSVRKHFAWLEESCGIGGTDHVEVGAATRHAEDGAGPGRSNGLGERDRGVHDPSAHDRGERRCRSAGGAADRAGCPWSAGARADPG